MAAQLAPPMNAPETLLVPDVKYCRYCGSLKPASEFYRCKSGRAAGRLMTMCKACAKNRANAWFSQNRARVNARQVQYVANNRESVKMHQIKTKYGLTKEAYAAMVKSCAICGSVKDLCIDHSHQSGLVRGMLCSRCNKGIGQFRDNPALLLRAADYVGRVIEKEGK